MNDTVVLVGLGVVIAAFVWFFIIKDKDEKTDPYVGEPKPEPVNRAPGGRASEAPIPESAKSPNTGPRPLPSKADLDKMTKANLEEFARVNYGIELDRRQTKANMIADLKKQHKAL